MHDINGVLILAGGKSERMNFPKAYLLYEGETFLKMIVDEYYNAGIKNIFVVLNEDFCYGAWQKYIDPIISRATIIKNKNSGFGRFHSLKLGVKTILDDSKEYILSSVKGHSKDMEFCFVQNIDNPFVNPEIINNLLNAANPEGFTSPLFRGKNGHPILISKKIIQHLNNLPDEDFNLRSILSGFPKCEVEVNSNGILANINTADDYENYLAIPHGKIEKGL